MRWRGFRQAFLGLGLMGVFAVAPRDVFAQELVTTEALNEWFYSRLLWAIGIGFFTGLAISMADLCRLPYPYKGALNVNGRARRKLTVWLLIVFLIGAVLLFIDAWFVFPFGTASLAFGEVFTQIWSNYRMIVVLLSMILVLVLVVGLATRLRPSCRCRYAFIPK
jgi:hypothetical protein